jgi:urease accessory protein
MTGQTADLALVRLLQLASPALPIGGYSYSQGLEWAIESGSVHDAESARRWFGDLLTLVLPRGEAAMAMRLLRASAAEDWPALAHWNAELRATRESAELTAESEQMAHSLLQLVDDLGLLDAGAQASLASLAPATLPGAYALAARGFGIGTETALTAYLWSWLENQVLCAIKTVPLGQVAGQRLLLELGARIPEVVATAVACADDQLANFAPGFAMASCRHETQYTRLFRS